MINVLALVAMVLMLAIYPFVVPQQVAPKTMVLNEPEIMSGANGQILDAGFDENGDLSMNYTFRRGNYTTGDARAGVVRPLSIEKDDYAVGYYANDSRFLFARFYASEAQDIDAGSYVEEVKVVCNAERVYYQVDRSSQRYYGKASYRGHCELIRGGREIPVQALITYAPDFWAYMFLCTIADFIFWASLRFMDEQFMP